MGENIGKICENVVKLGWKIMRGLMFFQFINSVLCI